MFVEIKRTFSVNKKIYLAGIIAELDEETFEEIQKFSDELVEKTNNETNGESIDKALLETKDCLDEKTAKETEGKSTDPPLPKTKEWFNEKTIKELLAIAEEKNIVINPKAKKAEIIEELLKN